MDGGFKPGKRDCIAQQKQKSREKINLSLVKKKLIKLKAIGESLELEPEQKIVISKEHLLLFDNHSKLSESNTFFIRL